MANPATVSMPPELYIRGGFCDPRQNNNKQLECCYFHPPARGEEPSLSCGPENLALPYEPEFCYYRTPCPNMVRPPLFIAHGFTDSCEFLSLNAAMATHSGTSITAAYTKILNGLSDTTGANAMCLSLAFDSSVDVITYIKKSMTDYVDEWAERLKRFTVVVLGLSNSVDPQLPSCSFQSVWPVNMVGFSQGGLVIRGYMQIKQGEESGLEFKGQKWPIVKNVMFVHSPLSGQTGMALCPMGQIGAKAEWFAVLCEYVGGFVGADIYSEDYQTSFLANYQRYPPKLGTEDQLSNYVLGKFQGIGNDYRLQNRAIFLRTLKIGGTVSLVMAEKDLVIYPKQSAHLAALAPAEVGTPASEWVLEPLEAQDEYKYDLTGWKTFQTGGSLMCGGFADKNKVKKMFASVDFKCVEYPIEVPRGNSCNSVRECAMVNLVTAPGNSLIYLTTPAGHLEYKMGELTDFVDGVWHECASCYSYLKADPMFMEFFHGAYIQKYQDMSALINFIADMEGPILTRKTYCASWKGVVKKWSISDDRFHCNVVNRAFGINSAGSSGPAGRRALGSTEVPVQVELSLYPEFSKDAERIKYRLDNNVTTVSEINDLLEQAAVTLSLEGIPYITHIPPVTLKYVQAPPSLALAPSDPRATTVGMSSYVLVNIVGVAAVAGILLAGLAMMRSRAQGPAPTKERIHL